MAATTFLRETSRANAALSAGQALARSTLDATHCACNGRKTKSHAPARRLLGACTAGRNILDWCNYQKPP